MNRYEALRDTLVDRPGIAVMIAERSGGTVTQQYVHKLTTRRDFPEGIKFSIGTLWLRDEVAEFLATPRKPGPKGPRKAKGSP